MPKNGLKGELFGANEPGSKFITFSKVFVCVFDVIFGFLFVCGKCLKVVLENTECFVQGRSPRGAGVGATGRVAFDRHLVSLSPSHNGLSRRLCVRRKATRGAFSDRFRSENRPGVRPSTHLRGGAAIDGVARVSAHKATPQRSRRRRKLRLPDAPPGASDGVARAPAGKCRRLYAMQKGDQSRGIIIYVTDLRTRSRGRLTHTRCVARGPPHAVGGRAHRVCGIGRLGRVRLGLTVY